MKTFDPNKREFLGDGVYARFDGYQVWIEVSDGLSFFNPIAIDRGTYDALRLYAERFYGKEKQ